MSIIIEIAVSDETNTTEQGRILEKLGKKVLESMQYEVIEEIRLTGMEVDLLARHKINSEEIYVECKAHRNNLSADVITKLLGNVDFKGVSSGWLLSTATFGKDAKGLYDEWDKKSPDKKRRLHLYTPERLVDLLISSKSVCDPTCIDKSTNLIYSDDSYLLLTNYGYFWAVPIVDAIAGVNKSVMLFDVSTGKKILDDNVLNNVSKVNSSLKELSWLKHNNQDDGFTTALSEEKKQSIVNVPKSDHWADYRPARPEDFVGRKNILTDIYTFFDNVRDNSTKTRIIAIKSPSGWGKSSTLLKLVASCQNIRKHKKYFMFAVDSRAAISSRYGELALIECFNEAIRCGFVQKPMTNLKLSGTSNPFSDISIIEVLESLKKDKKIIVLFFDQFEEIFAKQELAPLFKELSILCSAIDSVQENFVLGFSWKTDGTIPQDHPAYHMWQSLADRRKEFNLIPFTGSEVSSALSLFAKELSQSINPQLRRILSDHCQGYPWLLKKLCIHVYNQVRNGIDQTEIIGQALNIEELFKRELEELPGNELSCIQRIATDSPAEFFKIENIFGGDTVSSLINKRLILRSGSRLILYWDIFRDYVLTKKVPHIPVSYIPQTDIHRYIEALKVVLNHGETSISGIMQAIKVGEGTADNIIRDMVMIGNAESIRKDKTIKLLQQNDIEAVKRMSEFWKSHIIYRHLINEKGVGFVTNQEEIQQILKSEYSSSDFAAKTWDAYSKRIIRWWETLGLIIENGNLLVQSSESSLKDLKQISIKSRRAGLCNFLGVAPPKVVSSVIRMIMSGITNKQTLLSNGCRNSLYVLYSLSLLSDNGCNVTLVDLPFNDVNEWLAEKANRAETITYVMNILEINPNLSSKEIGDSLAEKLNFNWSDSTKKRYGSALAVWCKWIASLKH